MTDNDERDRDTWARTDRYIAQLVRVLPRPFTKAERRDLELLLRRYRKATFGSALTDQEQEIGYAEINP